MACNSGPRVGRKRKEEYDGSLWLRRKTAKEANVIFAGEEDNWNTVEAVAVATEKDCQRSQRNLRRRGGQLEHGGGGGGW